MYSCRGRIRYTTEETLTDDVLLRMRIMFATVPAALGLLLTLVFPLSKARSLEIRRELNARKSIA